MLLAGLLITLSDAITKWLGGVYPVGQMLCARGAFFLLILSIVLLALRKSRSVTVVSWPAHLLRGGLSTGSAFLFVTSLQYLPLADSITIAFAAPLFITALAARFLGEQVGRRRWTAVLIGFGGVALIMKPDGDTLHWAVLLPLGAAFFESVRDILTRRMTVTESSLSMVIVSTAVVVLCAAVTSIGGWPAMSWTHAAVLAAAGLLFGSAHWLMAESLRLAQVVVVAPFRYSPVIWGLLLGVLIWSEFPDGFMLAGTTLVVGSGLYIFYRERQRT